MTNDTSSSVRGRTVPGPTLSRCPSHPPPPGPVVAKQVDLQGQEWWIHADGSQTSCSYASITEAGVDTSVESYHPSTVEACLAAIDAGDLPTPKYIQVEGRKIPQRSRRAVRKALRGAGFWVLDQGGSGIMAVHPVALGLVSR